MVKHVKKLISSAKYRRDEGLAVAEGVHLAQSIASSEFDPQIIVCAESALTNVEVQLLYRTFSNRDTKTLVVKDSLFESLSDIHAAVGIVVVFRPDYNNEPADISANSLLLESIQDPGNLGTILRTAAAAGVKSVYLSPGSASAWSPKALRAGMGAQFSLDIYENVDLAKHIAASNVPVLATDLAGDMSIYDSDLDTSAVWLFGNEGQGVSPQLLDLCAQRVTIPQADSTVESLNVSAAVAVCLFEQVRQRRL